MIFPKKRSHDIRTVGTTFCTLSFLVSQILVAVVFLNLPESTPTNLVLVVTTITAVYLLLIFTVTRLKRRGGEAARTESGNVVSESHRESFLEIMESFRDNSLSRLEPIDDDRFPAPVIERLREVSNEVEENLRPKEGTSESGSVVGEKTMLRFIQALMRMGSECISQLQKTDAERTSMQETMASMNTSIEASLPIIEKIILATEEYEAAIASKIFEKFEEIWEYSKTLVGDSERTLQIFSKGGQENGEGLAYIAARNAEISGLFRKFTEVVKRLETNAHSFLESSIEGLEKIRKTIDGIEDMAERIKVISINVRIEAARESGRNTGFNVLGQEITSFADQTSVFSDKTVSEIEETIGNLKPLRDDLLGNLNLVQEGMESVAKKMEPYNRIIDQGFVQMDNVTKNLNEISINILNKMKQTIGDLQYQDITNQEAMHIIEILELMKDRCAEYAKGYVDKREGDADRNRRIRLDILEATKSIITTGTEKKILDGFLAELGVEQDDAEALTGTTNLDDKTILF